jgi:aryl-alcohol dehydrogenase-like predicted oxidoreductase
MTTPTATAAGTVTIGGDLVVHRLGYGTLRITGPGGLGPPPDINAAFATLRSLPELGVNFVETSLSYGPIVSEMLVRQALHPYPGMVIASGGGLMRPGPGQWLPDCRPEMLRMHVESSIQALGVDRLDLWQLNRIDPKVPLDEQFSALGELQRQGLIRHLGLCDVSIEQIEVASKYFRVATVQHRYHVIDRRQDAVLERCERDAIPFIAYFPLATGALAAPDSVLARVAAKIGITPGQTALAWLLRRSPVIVPIPGTLFPEQARENVAAASVELTDAQFEEIDRIGKRAAMLRAPPPS